MTKHTGLQREYFAMRSRYAGMVMGGGRMPWKMVGWLALGW